MVMTATAFAVLAILGSCMNAVQPASNIPDLSDQVLDAQSRGVANIWDLYNKNIYGIHFYGDGAENTIKNGRHFYSLEMLYAMNWKTFTSTKKSQEKAKLQAIKNKGFTVILRIDYSHQFTIAPYGDWTARLDFANQAGDIATWMKDIVDIYIIGNEMTTVAAECRNAWWYAANYNGYDSNSTYDKIHAVDPVATVLMGALTGWPLGNDLIGGQTNVDWIRDVQNYVDQSGGKPVIDGYAIHAYSGCEYFNDHNSPTEDPRYSDVAGFNSFIEYLKPIRERHGTTIPVFITETNTYWMPLNRESDITYRDNWVKEAYQTVDEWNARSDLKILGLIWYTYSHFNDPGNRDIWGNAIMRTDNAKLNRAREDFAWTTANKNMKPGYPASTLVFQAENYTNSAEWINDTGVQNLDYYDVDASNQGGQYRNGNHPQNRPDIAFNATWTSFVVGWMEPGEWLRYTTIAGGRNYRVKINYARGNAGNGSVKFLVNGYDIGTVTVPSTGSWSNYSIATGPSFWLPEGFHEIKMVSVSGGTNVDEFYFEPIQ
jgi:hypothetical protein